MAPDLELWSHARRHAMAGETLPATVATGSLSAADLTARLKAVRGLADVETAVRGAHGFLG